MQTFCPLGLTYKRWAIFLVSLWCWWHLVFSHRKSKFCAQLQIIFAHFTTCSKGSSSTSIPSTPRATCTATLCKPQGQPAPVQWPQHYARVDEQNIVANPRLMHAKNLANCLLYFQKKCQWSWLIQNGGFSTLQFSFLSFTHAIKFYFYLCYFYFLFFIDIWSWLLYVSFCDLFFYFLLFTYIVTHLMLLDYLFVIGRPFKRFLHYLLVIGRPFIRPSKEGEKYHIAL